MAIKVNDYSYTPKGHFEPVTVSGSYHNIISVSWTKEINRRHSNIITTATYRNEDSYKAGDEPFQTYGYSIQLTEISSSVSASTIRLNEFSGLVDNSVVTNHKVYSEIGKQWLNDITSDSSNTNTISASYEVLKSQVPLYSGSRHVVDVL